MHLPIALIESSSFVPPDVIAAGLSLLSAILGWIFAKRVADK